MKHYSGQFKQQVIPLYSLRNLPLRVIQQLGGTLTPLRVAIHLRALQWL